MPGRSASETKLALEDVPNLLDATYAPAIVPGPLAPRLRLFWRASRTQRHLARVVDWETWVDLARRMGLTAAVNERGFARVAWASKAAYETNREALADLRRIERGHRA